MIIVDHSSPAPGAGVHRFRCIGAGLENEISRTDFRVVPAENASGVPERWTPFVAYLSRSLA